MSAHVRSIVHACRQCGKRAVVEVFNTRNASLGFYCTRHGHAAVRDLNALDDKPSPYERTSRNGFDCT